MKIHTATNKKRTVLIATLLALLLVAAATYSIFVLNNRQSTDDSAATDSSSLNFGEPTDGEVASGIDAKKETVKNDGKITGDEVSAQTPSESNSGAKVTVVAVYKSGSDIRIQTSISPIVSAGSCKLTATKSGSSSYTSTVAVQALPSNSTCEGFTVPQSNFSPGTWRFSVEYSNDSETSVDSKELEI